MSIHRPQKHTHKRMTSSEHTLNDNSSTCFICLEAIVSGQFVYACKRYNRHVVHSFCMAKLHNPELCGMCRSTDGYVRSHVAEGLAEAFQMEREEMPTFTFGDFEYCGQWQDDQPNGHGTIMYLDGSCYVGEVKNGKRHGQGNLAYRDGFLYEGQWKADVKHGLGTFTYPDGGTYEGQWEYDARHGHGRCTYFGGGSHEGQWKAGRPCGHGKITCPNGGPCEGQWE